MTAAPTAHSLIERIGREFRLGGHKAAAIAMVLEKAEIYLVSDLDDALVRRLFMEPYPTAAAAYAAAAKKCGPAATVLAMALRRVHAALDGRPGSVRRSGEAGQLIKI